MSKTAVLQYYQDLERAVRFGKTTNETSIRSPFLNLLNVYARAMGYELVAEIYVQGAKGNPVRPDGALKNLWGMDMGLWESKDEKDDLEAEIEAKIAKGYPTTNILFEDSATAILYQNGVLTARANMKNPGELHGIIDRFVNFKSPAVYRFEESIEKFKADIPDIAARLRSDIDALQSENKEFAGLQRGFLDLCRAEINPAVSPADVREMMIQHILTSDVFNKIFGDSGFHRHNAIAAELEKLTDALLDHGQRRNLLRSIEHYYLAIKAAAAEIIDHRQKQKFLKILYENFYKAYNPKAADRLGVVYTPDEIVKFMVEATDFLLEKHFSTNMSERNVEILDPATGTGTFICEIIEHISKKELKHKFKNEIFANEVAILPYYIANLNIEYTYQQRMDEYVGFPNLCFVDTLDNIEPLFYAGQQRTILGLTSENAARIKRQNAQKISVIIGNPPYNANQLNENQNNKNREYPEIDQRIQETYIKHSTAQKTKVYDMYARFLRWATDRLDKNGLIAFVSNNSFIDARTFDGFRKCVSEDFHELHIVDLKGNARTSGARRQKEGGNVFSDGIRVGVALYFLVKKEKAQEKLPGCKIYYHAIADHLKSDAKKAYLLEHKFEDLDFDRIRPDKDHNWINLAEDNDWESLLPLCSKDAKSGKTAEAVFEMYSLGVVTARDEWVYDFDKRALAKKTRFLIDTYNKETKRLKGIAKKDVADNVEYSIKWTRAVKNDLAKGKKYVFDRKKIIESLYRPFVKRYLYYSKELNEMRYRLPALFEGENTVIQFSGTSSSKPFAVLATDQVFSHDCIEKTQCLPLYRYEKGEKTENISAWALESFQKRYPGSDISKTDVFRYVYAVLHCPAYREKYAKNLKRGFPRIPLYEGFEKWAACGKELLELHLDYETLPAYPLQTRENATENPKTKLKADKVSGEIMLDEKTTLCGIPPEAWEYKLGSRSALEWVLEQYKEKSPSDPAILENFEAYRFSDYKGEVIDLLAKVCHISAETVRILGLMRTEAGE